MRPHQHLENKQQDFFLVRLEDIINKDHELVRLADMIDWQELDKHFGEFFANLGRPRRFQ